jgi:plastocyanin
MPNKASLVTGLAATAVVAAGLLASPGVAATRNVDVNDDRFFDPQNISSAVGGSIHWSASGIDDHSVTQDSLLFDTGAAAPNLDFTRTFSAGTFPYHCRKHGDQGMRGTVRVAPTVVSAPAGLAFTVKWAAAGTQTGNSFDVKYRVGSGAWKTWSTNTSARSMVFGKGGPVAVARGKTYSFQVRSGSGASESGFSPVAKFPS